MKKINIAVTAKMISGNFEPKFYPLIEMERISSIHILRKTSGPELDKLQYHLLPSLTKFKIGNAIISPFKLIFLIQKIKPDFILSYHIIPHAFFAYFASLLTGKPFIVGQTGGLIQKQCEKNWLLKFWVVSVLKKATFLNVPGEFSKRYWIKNGINPQKINILHSVIDTSKFYNLQRTKEFDFIFVGALIKRKRVDKIIKSFSFLHKENLENANTPKLLIVGAGPEETNLKDLCKKLNLIINRDVIFFGFSKDIVNLLNKSKIFVMASETEGLPVALMEAMACELTVIAPDVDNIKQAVNIHNGFLLENSHVSNLTEIMKTAFLNYEKHVDLRVNARKTIIDEHSVKSAQKKWDKIFCSLGI
jgi:glycosyltransferase involved in cell wall biosynthesis